MLTYHDSSSWHSAPETWQSILFVTQSTRQTRRDVTAGGTSAPSTTGSTTAATTIQGAQSTISTSAAGGPSPGVSRATYGDTGSTTSNGVFTSGVSYTRSTAAASHVTADIGLGIQSLTDTTSTRTAAIAWPSTYTTTSAIGTFPDTTETTTRTAGTSVTGTRNETYWQATTGEEISSTETSLSFGASTTTASHRFPALPGTVIIPDAQGGPLFNDAVVWTPATQSKTSDNSQVGRFTDFFETTASGNETVTVDFGGRISRISRTWQSYALSTATAQITETTTGTTSTQTGTRTAEEIRQSLNGSPWNSTEAPQSSTIWIGTITGSSTYTVGGGGTQTDFTYVRQTTSRDFGNLQFSVLNTTATLFAMPSFLVTWNTWQRSYTTSSTFAYPRSTDTGFLIESFSTGPDDQTWRVGSQSTTIEEWQELITTVSWTAWDNRTNAVLVGNFTASGSSGGGGNVTRESATSVIQQTYDRTDYSEAIQQPLVSDLSVFGIDWTMSSRAWQRMMPRGFLGWGDGFQETSPVFTALTSTLVEGDDNTALSLVASNLPRFGLHPDASVFATGSCWNSGGAWSGISGTWLGSTAGQSGPRTTASFSHRWVSTATTTSGTSTVTLSSTMTALYSAAMVGSITGEFWSEYQPKQNSSDDGYGRPIFSGVVGGAMGGLAPISSAQQLATFPPGGLTLTWETGSLATASMSTSTSSGPITVPMPAATSPVAYSFEPALLLTWVDDIFAPILTASVYDFPDYPY